MPVHHKTRYSARRSLARTHSRRNRAASGTMAALVALPVIAAGIGLTLWKFSGAEAPDMQFCLKRSNQHLSAVFIDNSLYQHSEAQLRDYRTALMRAWEALPANGRISLFSTAADRDGSLAAPLATLCKPPATAEEQAALGLEATTSVYLKRQADKASQRFNEIADGVLSDVQDASKIASDSPILEQLRSISMYQPYAQASSRSLTVITDGLQNSEAASFCQAQGHMPPFARFTQRPDYQSALQPVSLAGSAVQLHLVESGMLPTPQLPHCTQGELRTWWMQYFKGNGAASVTLHLLRY